MRAQPCYMPQRATWHNLYCILYLPQANHQNLLKLLCADSTRDMTNHRPRVRYQRMCLRASGPGPFASKWYCVKLACSVHDKLMQFQHCRRRWVRFLWCWLWLVYRIVQSSQIWITWGWEGFTWQATNNYTTLFLLYSIILPLICKLWALMNKQGRFYFDHDATKHCSFLIW